MSEAAVLEFEKSDGYHRALVKARDAFVRVIREHEDFYGLAEPDETRVKEFVESFFDMGRKRGADIDTLLRVVPIAVAALIEKTRGLEEENTQSLMVGMERALGVVSPKQMPKGLRRGHLRLVQ